MFYLALNLPVLSGQLIPRILSGYCVLILSLLIVSSVGPLLTTSKSG